MNRLQKTKRYAKLTIQSISADILFFYKTDIDFYKWIVVLWMLVILMIIKIASAVTICLENTICLEITI